MYTENVRRYGVAHRALIPDTIHNTTQYAINRREVPPTNTSERVISANSLSTPKFIITPKQ